MNFWSKSYDAKTVVCKLVDKLGQWSDNYSLSKDIVCRLVERR